MTISLILKYFNKCSFSNSKRNNWCK